MYVKQCRMQVWTSIPRLSYLGKGEEKRERREASCLNLREMWHV